MDFTAIKYSGQGSFKVKKGTIDKLLFLLKTIASVNDTLSYLHVGVKGQGRLYSL